MQLIAPHLAQSCALVVVSAGRGTRFGGWKQLAPIAGQPLLLRTLSAFKDVSFACRAAVLPREWEHGSQWASLLAQAPFLKDYVTVPGGNERADSVLAGVSAVPDTIEFVAVHDGARPFPPLEAMAECIKMLHQDPDLAAAIVAAPATDTIKRIASGGEIVHTEDRSLLLRAETPQVARRALLLEALQRTGASAATDEAHALELAGHRTRCVVHQGYNLKVTGRGDAELVEACLKAEGRVGSG
jgi:2-C-methyl-D-erythritol 4-phosphate cytidylyltransferase